ncbi:hypothetical protein DFA_02880 [Cavenderia fasciculata]|uniref:N-acetyltransferase domain-containing protein n=1 Tax=Cavenderia fasciculata TaxID=261658 RepID=F4PIQ7_CACFS|nr:uncharacterized protein DFA_02880 [Cavenderia fasciculata]EGG24636.1 hypothetical protein DFA_02880 [Cavenderia fasciculata]|eukprot:XP_004362487.1 hypothetical protein DFA_02880 [Cavenderia fasciculata]
MVVNTTIVNHSFEYTYYSYNCKVTITTTSKDDKSFVTGYTIETPRLIIRNIQNDLNDRSLHNALFKDSESIKMFGTGYFSQEQIDNMLDLWYKRLDSGIPYLGLMVFEKCDQETTTNLDSDYNKYVGHTGIPLKVDTSASDGESILTLPMAQLEYTILLNKKFWGKGYGSEIFVAVVHCLGRAFISMGLDIKTSIYASARVDNPASYKILEKFGMKLFGTKHLHGFTRNQYLLELSNDDRIE